MEILFKKLFDAVSQGVDAGYDGIIVTHGSDTLSMAQLSRHMQPDVIQFR